MRRAPSPTLASCVELLGRIAVPHHRRGCVATRRGPSSPRRAARIADDLRHRRSPVASRWIEARRSVGAPSSFAGSTPRTPGCSVATNATGRMHVDDDETAVAGELDPFRGHEDRAGESSSLPQLRRQGAARGRDRLVKPGSTTCGSSTRCGCKAVAHVAAMEVTELERAHVGRRDRPVRRRRRAWRIRRRWRVRAHSATDSSAACGQHSITNGNDGEHRLQATRRPGSERKWEPLR